MALSDNSLLKKTKTRLKFIDLARSVAILLMLEGHFVDLTLDPAFRDPNNTIYATWLYIRGFTAPMFLTVTGIVFVYLMLNSRAEHFFKNVRIKKGFKRVFELIFWGYVLQLYAFHVLQCIAFGILTILLIFGIYKAVKVIPLWVYYALAGTTLFVSNLTMAHLPIDLPWPVNAPFFIQNMIHGPGHRAVFPIIPWMGFTMYGAMIGCLLHDLKNHVSKWRFAISFLIIGFIFFWFTKPTMIGLDRMVFGKIDLFYKLDWLYERFGMVLMILGTLMVIEKLMGEIRQNLFLKIGQNTLTIYIIHMILLYGSLTGIGVNDYFNKNLTPWEATIGALTFISVHLLIIYFLDFIKEKLEFVLKPIRKFWELVYGIKPAKD